MASFCIETFHGSTCRIPGCKNDHQARICLVCAVNCTSKAAHIAHLDSRKHQLAEESWSAQDSALRPLWCPACDSTTSGDLDWKAHVATERHKTLVAESGYRAPGDNGEGLGERSESEREPIVWPRDLSKKNEQIYFCTICKKNMLLGNAESHGRGTTHKLRETVMRWQATTKEEERERGGVEVSHLEIGVDLGVIGETPKKNGWALLCITNVLPATSNEDVTVDNVELKPCNWPSQIELSTPFSAKIMDSQKSISPGQELCIRITCTAKTRGVFEGRLVFTVKKGTERECTIVRKLRAIVRNPLKPEGEDGVLAPSAVANTGGVAQALSVLSMEGDRTDRAVPDENATKANSEEKETSKVVDE